MPTTAIDIGVVLERRPARSAWLDVIWEARSVFPEPAAAERGAALGATARASFSMAGRPARGQYGRHRILSRQSRKWCAANLGGAPAAGQRPAGDRPRDLRPQRGRGLCRIRLGHRQCRADARADRRRAGRLRGRASCRRPFIKRKRDKADLKRWPPAGRDRSATGCCGRCAIRSRRLEPARRQRGRFPRPLGAPKTGGAARSACA